MSATTWRMNGLRSEAAVALLLCVLLINSGVRCDDPNVTPSTSDKSTNTTGANATTSSISDSTTALPGQNGNMSPINADHGFVLENDNRGDGNVNEQNHTVKDDAKTSATRPPPHPVAPEVMCVTKEQEKANIAVSADVNTSDCEATKKILMKYHAKWCPKAPCHLNISQKVKTVLMASPNATELTLFEALQGEPLKEELGVSNVQSHSSAGSTVFVGVLLAGLFLAAALIGGYCLKMRRGTDQKGMRLAEEAYPVDEQNQGNTLVSVAPLSPPEKPESHEKPSVNGETPEPTQEPTPEAPPSNGHSSAKTADTEL